MIVNEQSVIKHADSNFFMKGKSAFMSPSLDSKAPGSSKAQVNKYMLAKGSQEVACNSEENL